MKAIPKNSQGAVMKIEKFEEISFSCKAKKLELLKEYSRKNNVLFYCSINIPKSAIHDFEKFLEENDVYDVEFEIFIEDLLRRKKYEKSK